MIGREIVGAIDHRAHLACAAKGNMPPGKEALDEFSEQHGLEAKLSKAVTSALKTQSPGESPTELPVSR